MLHIPEAGLINTETAGMSFSPFPSHCLKPDNFRQKVFKLIVSLRIVCYIEATKSQKRF